MDKTIIVASLILGVSLVISASIIGERIGALKDGVKLAGPMSVTLDKPIEIRAAVSAPTPIAVYMTNGQELPVVVRLIEEKKVP